MLKWAKMKRVCLAMLAFAALALVPCMAQAVSVSKATPTAAQAMESDVPPVLQDRTFEPGDEGPSIELLKERMQELGYYRKRVTFNGKYDGVMKARIRQFQQNNALEENGQVDEATMLALYSADPVKGWWYGGVDTEPDVALVVPITNSAQWYLRTATDIEFRVTVKNISKRRTITAYEVSLYACDAQGKRVQEVDKLVMSGRIKPGETAWTTYVAMPDAQQINKVYMSLNRVRYEDGTYEIIEEPVYDCWEIVWPEAE